VTGATAEALTVRVRVLTVRSQNPQGRGGCIFSGTTIDELGNVIDATSYLVVRIPSWLLSAKVAPGQWWSVTGKARTRLTNANGFELQEWQLEANKAELERPSGEHVIAFIAENDEFKGIGWVKARRLWDHFGDRLYQLLDVGDTASLCEALSEDASQQAILAWAAIGNSMQLQWLHQYGIELSLGRKAFEYFGDAMQEKLEEDPYRLLSFTASWKHVDRLALEHFGVASTDPRRLAAAMEEACYRLFAAGHTMASFPYVARMAGGLLGAPLGTTGELAEVVEQAAAFGHKNGTYLLDDCGNVYPTGPRVMEAVVAKAIVARLFASDAALPLSDADITKTIAAYESDESVVLTDEQRLALRTAAANSISLITGGAGVGKTTVLKGLYRVFDAARVRVWQVALAGRAAQRMQEATCREAMTLASFLRNVSDEDLQGPTAIVVDETSMVDIITMYRLCERLPEQVRLVLVGDPSQLMPVGPGLVLHALVECPEVPNVALSLVKRYSGALREAALSIREGQWPTLSAEESAEIAFIKAREKPRSPDKDLELVSEAALRLLLEDPEHSQILSARRSGYGGTKELNVLCQTRLTGHEKALRVWSDEFECYLNTGFRLRDPVICTRNRYDLGLRNGSLGKLVSIEDPPRQLTNSVGDEVGYAIGYVLWDDGEERPLFEEMLDDIELAYAITTHKAQGSQWPRVIVCVTRNRLLDRTLVYTAVTRAQRQALLVGDSGAAKIAVEAPPKVSMRQVALGKLIRKLLQDVDGLAAEVGEWVAAERLESL
jgi:exodeoxyribonuclease V alpha subunit